MSSMKKPFGKIGKFKKQKNSQENTQPQAHQAYSKPISHKLKPESSKPAKNIYDAIRKQQHDKDTNGTVHKPTLNFKKNRLLKPDNNNEHGNVEESTELNENQSKVTPLLGRKGRGIKLGKSKEKPVINEQAEQHWDNLNQNKYDSHEQDEQGVMKQSQSKKLMKPNLFKGITQKRPKIPSPSVNKKGQVLNNSQVYQQFSNNAQGINQTKFNYQDMMKIQTTQININKTKQDISEHKVAAQNKRTRELSNLLNLQHDLYEQLVSITSTTPFQVYISKIKGGYLKNSLDQAFQEKNQSATQTQSFQSIDFTNQCPEDYQQSHGYKQSDATDYYSDFIMSVSPVIQELIRPSKHMVMPPISLLALNPVFKKFLLCPSPTFIYYSQQHSLSMIAIGQKLLICDGEIQSILDMGGTKIAGLKSGKIILWNGQNDKLSSLYTKISNIIGSTNFQLPSFITNQLQRISPYRCEGSIVSLIQSEQDANIYSFDSYTKLIKWNISKQNKKTYLESKQVIEITKLIQKRYLIGINAKKRAQIIYLLTSSGIFCYNGQQIVQKIELNNVVDFYLPKRTDLIYSLMDNSVLSIISLSCSEQKYQISLNSLGNTQKFREIIIPETQHQNRKISLFYHIFIVDSAGKIYQLQLLEENLKLKNIEGKLSSKQQDSDDQATVGMKSRAKSNELYRGVSFLGNEVEIIKIFNDLKCTSQVINNGLSIDKSVASIKQILIKNKRFLQDLMEKSQIFM